ncbi:hypothetical protein D3C87_118340 [compost metagenome]
MLDQVYEKAKKIGYKKKRPKIYFEAKNNGLISSEGCVPDSCQNDCFVGINISKISMPLVLFL